jgi:hypothetical protein
MTQDDMDVEKSVCNKTLKELQNEAPYLRASFLKRRRKAAIARGDI